MKRVPIIVVLVLLLAGCGTLANVESGLSLTTKSIANPVTQSDEARIEVAFGTAIQLLSAYKKACQQGAADVNCRSNVARIQTYTRNVPALVLQLRSFVDNNDQINATVIYNQLLSLYGNAKSFAATAGINLGSV